MNQAVAAYDVVDTDGTWYQSKASFPLVDPNSLHRFVPGRTVKIKPTGWIAMQVEARAFIEVADPSKPPPLPPVAAATKVTAKA